MACGEDEVGGARPGGESGERGGASGDEAVVVTWSGGDGVWLDLSTPPGAAARRMGESGSARCASGSARSRAGPPRVRSAARRARSSHCGNGRRARPARRSRVGSAQRASCSRHGGGRACKVAERAGCASDRSHPIPSDPGPISGRSRPTSRRILRRASSREPAHQHTELMRGDRPRLARLRRCRGGGVGGGGGLGGVAIPGPCGEHVIEKDEYAEVASRVLRCARSAALSRSAPSAHSSRCVRSSRSCTPLAASIGATRPVATRAARQSHKAAGERRKRSLARGDGLG